MMYCFIDVSRAASSSGDLRHHIVIEETGENDEYI